MLRPTSARCKPSLRGNQVFSDESLLIRHFLVDVGLSTDLIAILVLITSNGFGHVISDVRLPDYTSTGTQLLAQSDSEAVLSSRIGISRDLARQKLNPSIIF